MSESFDIYIDGTEVKASPGQTIIEAAEAAGIYIPRLCAHPDLPPYGSCRVCSVRVNGRFQAACIQPAAANQIIENETDEVLQYRRNIVHMLFTEGNHFCMVCERSGNCELQALAYRLGLTAPDYPYQWPQRQVDASHDDIYLDHNRCILCARCVRASSDVDGKSVFGFVGRGPNRHIAVNAEEGLAGTQAALGDKAMNVCPVGAILKKRVGFAVPVGRRRYDKEPIGHEIDSGGSLKEA